MRTKTLFVLIILASSCSAQERPKATLIFDSKIKNLVSYAIEKNNPDFFNGDYYWIVYKGNSFWGSEKNGIKYKYNYEDSTLTVINGVFHSNRVASIKYDYTGNLEFNFYFDNSIIGWLTKSKDRNIEVLQIVDFEKDVVKEIVFRVPKILHEISPVIIDSTKLLYGSFVLNSNGILDTLKTERGTMIPYDDDKIFMRKNSYMIDRYYEQENPKVMPEYNPIDFNKIVDNKLITQKLNLSNLNVKISNYRIESNYENIWLLSHKINPEKFLLYDITTNKAYPFELDRSIFKLENLSLVEPILSTETVPSSDVRFSYLTSMNESNIYIYMVKNGIKLYKVSDYKKLMQ